MTDCVHAWVLEADRTRDVPGVCRKCGAERVFTGTELYYDHLDAPFSKNGRPADPKRSRASKLRGAEQQRKAS